jgi:hypothetical protein
VTINRRLKLSKQVRLPKEDSEGWEIGQR